MVNRKNIAKIQIYFGIFLLIITLLGTIFIVKGTLEVYTKNVQNEANSWTESTTQLGIESNQSGLVHLAPAMLSSNLLTQGLILRTLAILFSTGVLILLVLGITLILQGLSNREKSR